VLTAAPVMMLVGCFGSGPAPDDASESPLEVPEAVADEGICERLGFEELDDLGAGFGYAPTLEEHHEDGGCSKRLGRVVDGSEREAIVLGATAYEFSGAGAAAAAYQDWITDGTVLSSAFSENAGEFDVSEAWDEGTIVANLEWSDGPQIRMVARSDRFLVTYRAMLSVKGSVNECGASDVSDCAIGPATVLDWFAESWAPQAAERLASEAPPD
jgi:hypothetical protein